MDMFRRMQLVGLTYGLLVWVGLVVSACGDDSRPCCEVPAVCFSQTNIRSVPNAGIHLRFRALRCDGEPLSTLRLSETGTVAAEVELIDSVTNQSFANSGEGASISSLGTASDFEVFVTVALDLSNSVVNASSCDGINDVNDCPHLVQINAAKQLIDVLLIGSKTATQTFVQIIGFGRSESITIESPFAEEFSLLQRRTMLNVALEKLKSASGRGTTALYNAYTRALETTELGARASRAEFVDKTVIIFTDGIDQAGDAENTEARRRVALNLKTELEEVSVFSIGLTGGPAFDPARIQELATSETNYYETDSLEEVKSAFRNIGTRILNLSKSNYVVGICTPREFGTPGVIIRVNTDEGNVGSTDVRYNTDNLNGDTGSCNAGLVIQCFDRQQNGDETGVDCGGSCGVECVDPCTDGVINGDEEGIDCGGSCPSLCSRSDSSTDPLISVPINLPDSPKIPFDLP